MGRARPRVRAREVAALVLTLGCGVPASRYDFVVAEKAKANEQLGTARDQISELQAKVKRLEGKQSRAYAAICEKYAESGGSSGPLGPLKPGSDDSGGAKLDFQNGIIAARQVSPGNFEAHEVHGLIFDTYMTSIPEGNGPALLGFPISDEEPWDVECPSGRRTRFERGAIVWCPGWKAAEPRR